MRWKDWDLNLKVRLYGEFLINVIFWMFFPFMAIYFSEELGKGLAGTLLIVSQLVGVFANLFGGYCADKFGRKKMMVFSAFGQGAALVCFAFANSPWFESPLIGFICFAALGIFGSFYWPASHAMVADVVPEKQRAEVFAVFYTAVNISVVIGPILGGIFFFKYRFGLLLVGALLSFVLMFFIQKLVRETAPTLVNPTSAPVKTKSKWYDVVIEQMRDYRVIINDKAFLLYIVGGILVAQSFTQMDLLLAVYMSEKVPVQELLSFGDWSLMATGEKAFGWIVAENGLLVVILTVFISRIASKYYERNVFIISAVFYAIAMLVFGSSTNIWMLALGMFIFTMGELSVVGIQDSFISKLAPEHMRGQYFAAGSLRFTIGRTIAPVAIPLAGWVGYQWTFVILSLLALAAGGMYVLTFKLYSSKNKSEELQLSKSM